MNRLTGFVVLTFATAGAGCASGSGGAWTATGFEQHTYGWNAKYPAQGSTLLASDWQLDNWTKTSDGLWEEKDGVEYMAISAEDADRNGTIDKSEKKKVHLYDLKFTNAHDNGVIWVQTRTMHALDAQKDLDVLLENYASSLVGTGLYAQGTVFGTVAIKTRSFTTFVKDKADIKLGPHDAQTALIELAETDRLRADPEFRSTKLRIVLTKFNYLEEETSLITVDSSSGPPPPKITTKTAVMLIGYSNDPGHFDTSLKDFEAFVGLFGWPDPHPVPARAAPKPADVPPPPT